MDAAQEGIAERSAADCWRRLRAIKRYLATRTDSLPWPFVSERGTQLARQAVNYLIACIGQ
jgi:hypothetical protein